MMTDDRQAGRANPGDDANGHDRAASASVPGCRVGDEERDQRGYEENGMWVTHSETHIEDLK